MKKLIIHFKVFIFRGLLAVIPLTLTIFAVRIVYGFIDKSIMGIIDRFVGFRLPGIGVLFVFFILYVIGLIASNVLGKQIFGLIERISNHIPLVKTTYQVGKQVSNTLSKPEKQVFQKAVLIDYFRSGTKVIGFVTGSLKEKTTNEKLLKIFLPTPPNPTSGIVVIVNEKNTIDPGWSVDEALKMVISGGIIGPEEIVFNGQ